jgi:hypothetical protein
MSIWGGSKHGIGVWESQPRRCQGSASRTRGGPGSFVCAANVAGFDWGFSGEKGTARRSLTLPLVMTRFLDGATGVWAFYMGRNGLAGLCNGL